MSGCMEKKNNLKNTEAFDKISELVEKNNLCFFCTGLANKPFSARPMSTVSTDDNALWFFCSTNTELSADLYTDNHVQLLYSTEGHAEFLSVFGRCEIITDIEKKKDYWKPMVKNWFPEGVSDPDLLLLKVIPTDGYYWDTKHGRLVSLLKMAIGTITGKTMDDGIKGELHLNDIEEHNKI